METPPTVSETLPTRQATFTAEVIQFMRPSGRPRYDSTELPDEFYNHYESMIESGCRFEAEVLVNGMVSITISDPKKELDLDISLTNNGPEIQKGMIDMLERGRWKTSDASHLSKPARLSCETRILMEAHGKA